MNRFRERIYAGYVTERSESLAPATVDGLRPRARYLGRLIKQHFPKDHAARIIDLGCGHGALIHFAHQHGYVNMSGVDGSEQQVEAARNLGISGVRQGELMEYLRSELDGAADAIVTFDVIEHLTKEELIDVVDEVRRVLKPDGKWLIHAPNGASPFFGRVRYGDCTHEGAFTATSISQVLLASGFSRVESFEDTPVPASGKGVVRWVLWRAIRMVLRSYLAVETGSFARDELFSQNFLTVAEK